MKKIGMYFLSVGFILISLFAYRIAFLLTYADRASVGTNDVIPILLTCIRFDLSTSAYILIPFIVLLFIPYFSWKDTYTNTLFLCNLCWLILVDIYLFVDLLYYPFASRHLSFELFTSTRDIQSIIKIGFLEYAPQVLFLFLFLAGLRPVFLLLSRKILKKLSSTTHPFRKKLLDESAAVLTVITLSIAMARGGFQMKPITLSDSAKFNSPFLQHLILNGIYTTLRTLYRYRMNDEMKGWEKRYCSHEEASKNGQAMIVSSEKEEIPDQMYPLYRHFRYRSHEFRPLNVVIFVMESWSSKFVGAMGGEEDATPFFSRLATKGILLKDFFANGQRSIQSISAITTSIPPCGGMVLSQSSALSQMPVKFLPTILREKSYKTFFIHGAKRGSMGIKGLVTQTGIDTYISKEDIAKDGGRDDGIWGIYDEDTFLYADRLFERQNGPFFTIIFSLSSHAPYKLPSERFIYYTPEVPYYKFLNVLRYSDYSLSRFFEEAAKKEYFKNTLFIIVGDHTEGKSTGNDLYEKFSVPCLLYSPRHLTPLVVTKTTTQVDLVPTILDILKSSDPFASFGQSAFSRKSGFGLLAYDTLDVFVRDGWMFLVLGDQVMRMDHHLKDQKEVLFEEEEKISQLIKEEMFYVQLFHDIIMTNTFYARRPS